MRSSISGFVISGLLVQVIAGADSDRVRVPARPANALFRGQQGAQRSEIHFDPATKMVTVKLVVQDPNGYFIPNIRRDDFVVYEDGVPQKIAGVDVEYAPAKLLVLMEYGGRNPALSRALGEDAADAGRQLTAALGKEDCAAVYKYGRTIEKLADFSQPRNEVESVFYALDPPQPSETNMYHALVSASGVMKPITGRKAIVLLSSGVDTSSQATREDALNAVRDSGATLYVIGLSAIAQREEEIHRSVSPMVRTDWKKVDNELVQLAHDGGGRAYIPSDTINLSPVYDDLLENLKVRYVIRYQSSSSAPPNQPRKIRVELVDPETKGPLEIVDANGKVIRAKVAVQDSYMP